MRNIATVIQPTTTYDMRDTTHNGSNANTYRTPPPHHHTTTLPHHTFGSLSIAITIASLIAVKRFILFVPAGEEAVLAVAMPRCLNGSNKTRHVSLLSLTTSKSQHSPIPPQPSRNPLYWLRPSPGSMGSFSLGSGTSLPLREIGDAGGRVGPHTRDFFWRCDQIRWRY